MVKGVYGLQTGLFARGKRLPIWAALLLSGFMIGCGGGEAETGGTTGGGDAPGEETRTVGFVTNQIADFWKIAEAGCRQAETDFGINVVVVMPPEATAVVQKQKVEDLITGGLDGLAISPLDAENQVGWINELAAEMPLITHDSDAPGSDRLVYIGMDNYKAGRMCGELLKEALPDGGDVLLCIGRLEQDNSKFRRQGVIDALFGRDRDMNYYRSEPDAWDPNDGPLTEGNFTIVATVTDQGKPEVALAKAEDALNTYPELKGMAGLFEYNPPACFQALSKAGKLGEVALAGFDENDVTLQAIKDGECVGTVVQDPFQYGYQSVRVLNELLSGNDDVIPESQYIDVPPRKITRDNVDAFREDLAAKKG